MACSILLIVDYFRCKSWHSFAYWIWDTDIWNLIRCLIYSWLLLQVLLRYVSFGTLINSCRKLCYPRSRMQYRLLHPKYKYVRDYLCQDRLAQVLIRAQHRFQLHLPSNYKNRSRSLLILRVRVIWRASRVLGSLFSPLNSWNRLYACSLSCWQASPHLSRC
jgi:hypothetical protein